MRRKINFNTRWLYLAEDRKDLSENRSSLWKAVPVLSMFLPTTNKPAKLPVTHQLLT